MRSAPAGPGCGLGVWRVRSLTGCPRLVWLTNGVLACQASPGVGVAQEGCALPEVAMPSSAVHRRRRSEQVVAVMIGVDPHKLSNTIVVIDDQENVLARHRFANDREGYRALKATARAYRERTWAVEGAQGVGVGLAQR